MNLKNEYFNCHSVIHLPSSCKQCVHNPLCKHPRDCHILEQNLEQNIREEKANEQTKKD
jgi:hypothetical protein